MASKGAKLASAKPDKVPSSKLEKLIPKSGTLASTTGSVYTDDPRTKTIPIDSNLCLTLSFTWVQMCIITLSANIFRNKRQKCLHFFTNKL